MLCFSSNCPGRIPPLPAASPLRAATRVATPESSEPGRSPTSQRRLSRVNAGEQERRWQHNQKQFDGFCCKIHHTNPLQVTLVTALRKLRVRRIHAGDLRCAVGRLWDPLLRVLKAASSLDPGTCQDPSAALYPNAAIVVGSRIQRNLLWHFGLAEAFAPPATLISFPTAESLTGLGLAPGWTALSVRAPGQRAIAAAP